MKALRAAAAIAGMAFDEGLERFAAWACRRGGVSNDSPKATDGDPLRGYTIPDYVTGEPYLTRILLPRMRALGLNLRPMLHHIHRADHERDLHDHPWSWAFSIVLRGSYDEERLCTHDHGCEHVNTRHVKWFNLIRGSTLHRITKLHGDVWTLFITGPRVEGKTWGFREWDTGYEAWRITPNQEYITRRKAERIVSQFESGLLDASAMTGEQLDAWASILGIERHAIRLVGESPDGQSVPEYDEFETDDDLRRRILDRLQP